MDAFVLGFVFAAPVFLIVGYCCGLYDGTKGWAAPDCNFYPRHQEDK